MSVRTEKVSSLVKERISEIFQHHFRMEEYGLMTVTEVRMTPDLKIAKVYVSVFGDAERKRKTLALLEVEKAFIRTELGRNLHLKFTPSIMVYLDESLDHAMHIESLLHKIHKDPGSEEQERE
ncbi:MAG: ribosome-binding factor A [Ignavibacteria bacterium GWA2_55_25]|nr:MAG: ribosome-binding factor A [Ignavibacteria bacterium GWA2_55_25]